MSERSYRRVGILCNPLSGRIKKKIAGIREMAQTIPGAIYRDASNRPEIESVLGEFIESSLDLLVIIAGDGTIHAVLTSIFNNKLFAPVPPLAIIPAGTTNMTAKDFNIHGKPKAVLARLKRRLQMADEISCISRPVLRIQNGDSTPECGMFFGTGLIASGVKYFSYRVRSTGITGEKASALVLLRFLVLLLLQRTVDSTDSSVSVVQLDNERGINEKSLFVFASSLNRLLLGMRPYWGNGKGPIHFTLVRESPDKLWRSWLPLITGNGKRLAAADGYLSRNLSEVTLRIDGDYVIDGEIYSADAKKGAVRLTANDSISVVEFHD